MAIQQLIVEVIDEPTRLDSTTDSDLKPGRSIMLCPSADIWIGNTEVAVEDGFKIAANGVLTVDLGSGDKLFAVAVTTSTVSVLQVGV